MLTPDHRDPNRKAELKRKEREPETFYSSIGPLTSEEKKRMEAVQADRRKREAAGEVFLRHPTTPGAAAHRLMQIFQAACGWGRGKDNDRLAKAYVGLRCEGADHAAAVRQLAIPGLITSEQSEQMRSLDDPLDPEVLKQARAEAKG